MREIQHLFLGLRLVSKIFKKTNNPQSKLKLEQQFGGFVLHINVRQPIGRKDSKQTVIPTSRRLDPILYEAAQNFELFSNIQGQK
jgi:hypothetical protein